MRKGGRRVGLSEEDVEREGGRERDGAATIKHK